MGKITKQYYCTDSNHEFLRTDKEEQNIIIYIDSFESFNSVYLDKKQVEELVKELQEHLEGM